MKQALVIAPTHRTKSGEFIPCFVREDCEGYFPTDLNWGKDLKVAKTRADAYNTELGLTAADVEVLFVKSMFPGANEQAIRQGFSDRGDRA